MHPIRHPALALLALAAGALAQASVGFQVYNPTARHWTLVPTAEGPLGTRETWDGQQLGVPEAYRAKPGEGVPVPPGHSVRFYHAGPQGSAFFHLCDHRWVAGQSADGGPANPHSVRLGVSWETPDGQQQPAVATRLDTAPGSAERTQAQLGRLGGWSGDTFTLRALAHPEPESGAGAESSAATGATVAMAGLGLDSAEGFEVLDQGTVVPAGSGSGWAAAAGGPGTGIQGGAGAAWGAGAGGAGTTAVAPPPRAQLPAGSADAKFEARLKLFAAFIQDHPGEAIPCLDEHGRHHPLHTWAANTRQRLAKMSEARQAAFRSLYDTYRNALLNGAGAQAARAPKPAFSMKIVIENHDRRVWRLWRATGRAVPLRQGALGTPEGRPAGYLVPDGLRIQPETWVELDYGQPATRLAEAWKHSPSQDCLATEAGLLFRHHLFPDPGELGVAFTFGIGYRPGALLEDAGGSRVGVHPDPDQKLPTGILTWAGNRIVIRRQEPGPAGETKAAPGPGGDGGADAAPAASLDWSLEPAAGAAGAGAGPGWAPGLPFAPGYGIIPPLEADPLEPTGDAAGGGALEGLATLFSLPDGFGDNVKPDQLP